MDRPTKEDDMTARQTVGRCGQNLLFTPGVFHLNDTIRVTRANTVVLGLATLIPDNGVTAMTVPAPARPEPGGEQQQRDRRPHVVVAGRSW
jgi:hypothetical protein